MSESPNIEMALRLHAVIGRGDILAILALDAERVNDAACGGRDRRTNDDRREVTRRLPKPPEKWPCA